MAQIKPIGWIAISLVIIAAIVGATMLSVIMGPGGELRPLIIDGEHIQNYNELRSVSGQELSDSEFENAGIIQQEDGLYAYYETGVAG